MMKPISFYDAIIVTCGVSFIAFYVGIAVGEWRYEAELKKRFCITQNLASWAEIRKCETSPWSWEK